MTVNDKHLLPFLAKYLEYVEEGFKGKITFTEEKLSDFDAVIATGSDNTARYFEYYFKNKPNIIRKSRNSVAVLTGNETKPFIGRYTNTIDTLSISYKDKNFVEDQTNKLLIRDTSTLVINNKAYLEFNDDMSMLFILLNRNKPHYKRIQEDE